ncbi:PP2C family protein-serine/threonine phosphatase [Streptomyces sp. NPDC088400]|uniref:PP2C family protein-serine/threonine phosphatase n=1 Tax=Streptomyces sp. NPDC088400 TaxID=3365861 RepID=UPI003805A544
MVGDAPRVVGGRPGRTGPGARTGRRLVRYLPALVIAVGVLFDITTPTRVTSGPLFAAAPLVAAPFYSMFGTSLVALASLIAELALRLRSESLLTVEATSELLTVVVVSVLALYINAVVRRSGERLASARIIAETAQRAVLPRPAERIGGLRVAARYEAAQEGAYIGGDLFAVQDTRYGVRLVVGDVRGKGLDAVEAVAVIIGSFREAAEQESSLEGVAQRLERALTREGTRPGGLDSFEGFTTAVLAEIPHGEGVVRLVNRGHPEPLLMCGDGTVRMLVPSDPALPLGMSELGSWPDRAEQSAYPAGATLLFYTDGLTEARDDRGVFYLPRERLDGRTFPGPDELLQALIDDVRMHTGGGSQDDMALLAVSRPVEGEPERRRSTPVVP